MQGIYVDGRRPQSKKQIREAAAADPFRVTIEATSIFGDEYEGSAARAPENQPITFVGPDPYHKRTFYGTLVRRGEKVVVK